MHIPNTHPNQIATQPARRHTLGLSDLSAAVACRHPKPNPLMPPTPSPLSLSLSLGLTPTQTQTQTLTQALTLSSSTFDFLVDVVVAFGAEVDPPLDLH